MTLIADLINVPERVHRGDFVLTLADGVVNPSATLRDYIVTPQLKVCFDEALTFIRESVYGNRSKATYLHGSFGAGKSHFMAVLHLILSGDVRVRDLTELTEVLEKHSAWLEGRRFLMVPYHMTGARDMESAILGQYAAYVQRLFPGVAPPGFYLSEGLFSDARALRGRMGDGLFFEILNEAAGAGIAASMGGSGWGNLSGGWDAETFDAAMAAPPEDADRQRLVGDLISSHFRSYAALAASQGEGFISLDEGLAAMSRHAQGLGFDAVVLFLDELILWLASRSVDLPFVTREGVKLSKLVESQGPARAVPIISFVARQRDLRDLVGEHVAGAEQLKFADVLKYWEARFHKITLEDRNLPEIANRRVLKPRSAAAARTFNEGVDSALRLRQPVLETLLAGHYTVADFRKVYPFSPALIDALVAVSSVLQRERTALKLLLQLLVDKRHELALGDIVPVGDLFDVISDGDDPFSEAMKVHYENARRLWQTKLQPLLERETGVNRDDIAAGRADLARATAFRNDGRILKTLLLAALVPEVKPLKDLTPARIAALNHGTIISPIPGREAHEVLRRCQRWAAEVGEIKLSGDPSAPVISIHITGVDTSGIIANGERYDNEGNRRAKVRDILYREVGVSGGESFFASKKVIWRGSERRVEVCYDNVREMSDDRLQGRNENDGWTVVIDFPFDQASYGPSSDIAKIEGFLGRHPEGAGTLVWLPSFLSARALEDLKKLVILDHLLAGDRFDQAAGHLSQIDRVQARDLLRNQRDQLEQAVRMALEQAYGIRDDLPSMVDDGFPLNEHWHSLDRTFAPRPPVGANLRAGLESLLDQLFVHLTPGHPDFGDEVKVAAVRTVLAVVEAAAATADGRIAVDRKDRADVRRLANPLELGEMHETHFVLGHKWRLHFLRKQTEQGGPVTVRHLRAWIDDPRAMGLPTLIQNLIILAYAAHDQRSFFLRGGPARPTLDSLSDELELRQQSLPAPELWQEARRRAALLFGCESPDALNATNVAKLVDSVTAQARRCRPDVGAYAAALEAPMAAFGLDGSGAARLRTARSACVLLDGLLAAGRDAVVPTLAAARLETTEAAVMRLLGDRASSLCEALRRVSWPLFDGLRVLSDARRADAEAVLGRVREALAADEQAQPLGPLLDQVAADAVRLLTVAAAPEPAPPREIASPQDVATSDGPARRRRVVASGARQAMAPDDACKVLDQIRHSIGSDGRRRLTVTWQVEEDG